MRDLFSLLWYALVGTAVLGAVLSIAAYMVRSQGPGAARVADRLYLLSYVLMSVSIAIFAVRGLLR
jgi:small neutral amino acid transporter SnatA (MarC family)